MLINPLDLLFPASTRFVSFSSGTVAYGAGGIPWTTTPLPFGEMSEDDFPLRVETAVIVPSTTSADRPVSKEEYDERISDAERFVSGICGGFTTTRGEGGYWSDDLGELIIEDIARVASYCPIDSWKERRSDVRRWLKARGDEWGQEAMGFEFEGDLYYIPVEGD